MTGSPAIRLRGIVRAFGAIRAVANLDLDVARGNFSPWWARMARGKAPPSGFSRDSSGPMPGMGRFSDMTSAGRPPP